MHNHGRQDDGHPVGYLEVIADEVTCQQFVELVTDYFEGALAPRMLSQVEEHLVMCDWCIAYVAQMQTTVDSLANLKDRSSREPPDLLLGALRSRAGR